MKSLKSEPREREGLSGGRIAKSDLRDLRHHDVPTVPVLSHPKRSDASAANESPKLKNPARTALMSIFSEIAPNSRSTIAGLETVTDQ